VVEDEAVGFEGRLAATDCALRALADMPAPVSTGCPTAAATLREVALSTGARASGLTGAAFYASG
jgi:hypothetical protein